MAAAQPRVGVAFNGDPRSPAAFSGIPYGVLAGLRANGAVPVPLDASISKTAERALCAVLSVRHLRAAARRAGQTGAWRLARRAAQVSPPVARASSAALSRRLKDAGRLDGLVQIGSAYEVETDAPVVTFDDMIVPQALEYPYEHWAVLGERDAASRRALQEEGFRRARAVCATSSWAAVATREHYGIPPERLFVVGMGNTHAPRTPQRDWSVPRFLFVGLDWRRKNGPAVLDAFARVRREHPGARLDVVGGHPPLSADGVSGHGVLARERPADRQRLVGLYDAATCFVLPSRWEPSAISYTEALSAGVPSIGSTVGGSGDLIGDAGVVVDPFDQSAIESAMLRLAEPAEAGRLGRAATERSALFTWEAVTRRLLRALGLGFEDAEFLPLDGSPAGNA